jgi:hypothetical protein
MTVPTEDEIRKAAEVLLSAGIFLAGHDFDGNGFYPFASPEEVVEHVVEYDRREAEYDAKKKAARQ